MSIVALDRPAVDGFCALGQEDAVRDQVHDVLRQCEPESQILERRGTRRRPFPALLMLFPEKADLQAPSTPPMVVVAKDISEKGLGFFHPLPIHDRKVRVIFEGPDGTSVGFVVDIRWCRFTRQGWYESGGRLLDVFTPPRQRAS